MTTDEKIKTETKKTNSLHPQAAKKIKQLFGTAFSVAQYKDGLLLWEGTADNLHKLVDELFKNSTFKKHLTPAEIQIYVLDLIYAAAASFGKEATDFSIGEKISNDEIENHADKFIEFLNGIPYKHVFYFRLPLLFPEGINEIEISKNLKLLRIGDLENLPFENPISTSLSALAKMLDPRTDPIGVEAGEVYAAIEAEGYDESAQSEAFDTLKKFLFLSIERGNFDYQSWNTPNPSYVQRLFFIRPNTNGRKKIPFSLPASTISFLSKIALNPGTFKTDWEPPEENASFLSGSPYKTAEEAMIADFKDSNIYFSILNSDKLKEDRAYIEAAIAWGYEGVVNENDTFGFIQTCIGLEALLGDEKKSNNEQYGVTAKLADRCAHLLGTTKKDRQVVSQKFLEIYDLRSKLVHGRKQDIEGDEQKIIWTASSILSSLIFKEIDDLDRYHRKAS